MQSFCRSGLLALTLVSGSIANVQAQIQRMTHQSWVSDVSIERLQDGSVLTEYFGEGASTEHKDIFFRIGFIPRFGCAPLITFEFGNKSLSAPGSGFDSAGLSADLNSLAVTIDDASLPFPLLIDYNNSYVSMYMNADLRRRITTRLRVDVGDLMKVSFRSGKELNFLLQGSRDAVSIANQNCRRHDPSNLG